MKQETFEHISKDRGVNQNHFVMASNDVRPLGRFDVTTQTITPAPVATIANTM